jgi:catechol 2,3-dioxygenase-like lactoylglutathione lyase family enzyme
MIGMASSMQRSRIQRLASFGLTTPDARQLSEFYEHALGFRMLAIERRSGPEFERLMSVEGGAAAIMLGLGDEVIELLQFDRPGRPYPDGATSSDLCFQHFAIIVADIQLAYQKLVSVGGWTAISNDGPQQLPASSGGVTAFKFRDPDGHPLELLSFPNGKMPEHWQARSQAKSNGNLFLGIDHSAISVADSAASIAFYEGLGLRVAGRSLNTGPEQERLDGVKRARVEVTALEPRQTTPHVELLCYRSVTRGADAATCNNDVAATRLLFEVDEPAPKGTMARYGLIDPDGHHLVLSAPINASTTTKMPANADSSPRLVNPE